MFHTFGDSHSRYGFEKLYNILKNIVLTKKHLSYKQATLVNSFIIS